jgi:hypothetical protein
VIGGTTGLEAPIPLSISLNFTKARSRASESAKRGTRDIQVSHTSPKTRNSRREVKNFVEDGGFMEGSQRREDLEGMYIKDSFPRDKSEESAWEKQRSNNALQLFNNQILNLLLRS